MGSFHVEHVFVDDPEAPFMRREHLERPRRDGSDPGRDERGFPTITGEVVPWACHNVAEAVATAIAHGEDYLATKSQLWRAIAGQPGLATVLRRSAKARLTTAMPLDA
jgi:hypothetical protein